MTAPTPSIRNAGDRALLLTPGCHEALAAVVGELRRNAPAGVQDVLPAAETVLVTLATGAERESMRRALLEMASMPASSASASFGNDAPTVTIPVRYDGDDLPAVASTLGLDVEGVVAEHTSRTWRCAFLGFAPGFGYLEPDRPGLAVSRRTRPRTSIPAGAVALADGYSAVYPRRSPGGWQIIGTTDTAIWDLHRREPALLQPGTMVRFVAEHRIS